MEWEVVLVVLVTALAVSRTADVVNAILGGVLPSGNIGGTSLGSCLCSLRTGRIYRVGLIFMMNPVILVQIFMIRTLN